MHKPKNDEVYNRNIGVQRLKSLVERLRDPENGCPWDQKTVNACMSYNRKDCLDYAREHKCPGYERAVTYMHFYQERYQD